MKVAILVVIIALLIFIVAHKSELKNKTFTDKLLLVIAIEFAITLFLVISMMLVPPR